MKKILLVLVSLLMITTLSACHGNRQLDAFVVPEEFDTSRDYEITFWAKNDSNKYQVAIYRQAIEDFAKLYPNIHVTLKLYNDYRKIYNDVITNITTQTTPNVCITYPDHIATYLTGENIVTPLGELFDDLKYGFGGSELKYESVKKDEMIPTFLNEGYISNDYYAIPFMRSTEVLYINQDYVEKLGYKIPEILTWDFVWEVSEKALLKDENDNYIVNGQNIMIPFIYKSTDNMMISMLKQLDGKYSTDEGKVEIFNETTRKILEEIYPNALSKAFSTFSISSYPANFLNAGQCIFAIDSTAGSTWMGSNAANVDIPEDQIVQFKTAIRAIPQYDINNPKMISQGPSICIFNKRDNQEVLASWIFAQYLLTNDVQLAYSQTEGYLPVTNKALDSQEYQKYLNDKGIDNNEHYDIKIEATEFLMNNIENSFVTPVFNGSSSLREAAGQLIEEITKSGRRKDEIGDEYFETLFDKMRSLYRLDQVGQTSQQKTDLGPLPKTSKTLLISLAVVWTILGSYYLFTKFKKK